jgi:hypothetical protein
MPVAPLGTKSDPIAWNIIREFATTDMSLPIAETRLQMHLGQDYVDDDWRPALKAVMDAEGDVTAALEAVEKVHGRAILPRLTIKLPGRSKPAAAPQLKNLESEVAESIGELKRRKAIKGTPPTMEEFLEPMEERISESDLMFELEGGDEEIVKRVQHQIAVDNGEVMEVDSESDSDNEVDSEPKISTAEIMTMCQRLEGVCSEKMGGSDCVYHLSQNLRRFRGYLRREELKNAKQMTLDQFFSSSATRM